jgi:hypothetical protein
MALFRTVILSFAVLLFPIAVAASALPHDHGSSVEHVVSVVDETAPLHEPGDHQTHHYGDHSHQTMAEGVVNRLLWPAERQQVTPTPGPANVSVAPERLDHPPQAISIA